MYSYMFRHFCIIFREIYSIMPEQHTKNVNKEYVHDIISIYPCNNVNIYCRLYIQPQMHCLHKRL